MSYEYSAASARFEIDNPYKIENLALLACGAITIIAGLVLLIGFREAMGNADFRGLRAIIVGLLLLGAGIAAIGRAAMQLRYFFGRGRPHDLTNLEASDGHIPERRAAWLKENLRQNALAYREPQGAISGLVHQVFKTLIFAPRLIRAAAEAQCFNALLTLAILLGLLATVLFYPNPAVRSWLAVLYLAVLVPKLLRPFGRGGTTYSRANAGLGFILFVIAVPILGPPLLNRFADRLLEINGFELPRTLGICLVMLLAAQCLFFLALMRQLRDRPAINMACVQRSVSMNNNPAKLFEELERTLQARWTETIPNRRYALVKLPDVLNGQSGSFAGEVLEETQPVPVTAAPGSSILDRLYNRASLPITALTVLGALAHVGATFSLIKFSLSPINQQQSWSSALLAVIFFFTALYCLRSANLLWGRVDFNSVLVWVEINGSFEEARINIGNQLTTAMSSTKKIINVESMTLRVWAAELDTVILEKDGPRDLIGMRGRPDVAEFYANHLEQFAGQLASVIAPASSTDRDRITAMARAQQQMGAAPSLAALAAATPTGNIASTVEPRLPQGRQRCRNEHCRTDLPAEAMFCSSCGAPMRAG
jgi:hypothetical protein